MMSMFEEQLHSMVPQMSEEGPSKEGASTNDYMIEVDNIKKTFGNGPQILKGMSVNVQRGETLVVLGGSGMGKSVLMKHIIGLLKPDEGSIKVDGEEITTMGPTELKRVRAKFGMVFQNAALFDSMSNYDNVAFPLREHRKDMSEADIDKKVRSLFDMFTLDADIHGRQFPSELSGGQRKRVGLARAVALDPQIVLYDEPTTGLDPITTDQVDQMILDAQKALKVTSIVISHDIASAFNIADNIIFVYYGEIIARGTKEDMLKCEHPFVQEYFKTWIDKNK